MHSIVNKLLLTAFAIFFISCQKPSQPPPGSSPINPVPPSTGFVKGADISWITELDAIGKKFYNAAGVEQDLLQTLKTYGINTIRLRVWVNPGAGWNHKNDVVQKAQRAMAAGMRIMINFHYSDTWADPGMQAKPIAWSGNVSGLKTALANHTTDVLTALKTAGVMPEWVQVGNETDDGMLWPEGKASTNMANYAQFVNAGYDAVKAVFPNAKVIVHVSNGWDNSLFRWNIGGLVSNGAKFDVIGMSLYPNFVQGGWQTANPQTLANMNDMVSRYNKEVMVVEVGMPWDDAANCKAFLTDIITKTKSVSGGKGLGVLYWEPQSYGGWAGYTLGAFDNSGKPTVALEGFK